MIRVLAVGKKHESWVLGGIERYEKRLKQPWDIKWDLIPHSSFDGARARLEESERLIARLKSNDYVILLDETGTMFNSPDLSRQLDDLMSHGKQVTFVIGGAYGVNDDLKQRANLAWSLSPLVFPHQLVRLILTEQIYRASQISVNSSYHHE